MKKILDGEKGERHIMIDHKLATVTHCWRADARSQRYQLCFKYDFSSCTDEEIVRLAALWVNKDQQNRLRQEDIGEAGLTQLEEGVIDVFEMYNRERAGRDPVKSADSALAKMTPEQREELFAKYAKA